MPEQVVRLGTAIAQCAVRHFAAVQFTFYEPPPGASDELARLASLAPSLAPAAAESAMLETLRTAGRPTSSGRSRMGVLTDRIVQTMLHVGLSLFHRYRSVHTVAGLLCDILLRGAAVVPRGDDELGPCSSRRRSPAATKRTSFRVGTAVLTGRSPFGVRGRDLAGWSR